VVKPGEDFYFKGILGTFPPSWCYLWRSFYWKLDCFQSPICFSAWSLTTCYP
jgi:hypothetical protein